MKDKAMPDKFVSPCPPPEGHVRELLTVFIEEAQEVSIRCTKALRFGIEEVQPGQDLMNNDRIAHEVGDFLEVLDRLIAAGVIRPAAVEDGKANKKRQLDRFMQTRPDPISAGRHPPG